MSDITSRSFFYLNDIACFQLLVNAVLGAEDKYQFHVNEYEITESLRKTLIQQEDSLNTENVLEIRYEPQAVFRVKAVTR